jgi:cobaltochelatase CobN
MHRLAATPGGWTPEADGVILIEQSPAPIVILTAADTDVQLLASAMKRLPSEFPDVRVANLLQLQQQITIDTYAEAVLLHTKGIVVRLLGGRSYWSYGLEVLKQVAEQAGTLLLVLPGDDRPDLELMSHSTVPLSVVDRLWRYFTEGGVENTVRALQFVADLCLKTQFAPPAPEIIPRLGLYPYQTEAAPGVAPSLPALAQVGLLFYRAHYLAGNTAPIDALCQALVERQLQPVPLFVSSLQDPEVQAELRSLWSRESGSIQLLLNTTSFSLAKLTTETPNLDLWQQLDVPVLQVILSGGTQEQWQSQSRGLSPRDIAMNVALPEVDGRIITRAVSFKAVQQRHAALETDVVHYEPIADRVAFVAELAANWIRLQQTPVGDRRIALILANYPTRDGRLANGVGLDTPASCVEILKALQQEGYHVLDRPQTGDDLIQRLTRGVTNDPEGALRSVQHSLSWQSYHRFWSRLPEPVQQGVSDRWGPDSQKPAREAGADPAIPIASWVMSLSAFNPPEATIATPA